jgi:hypothetical protein
MDRSRLATSIASTLFMCATAADASEHRPTPTEFYAHVANGPSYGWDCSVSSADGAAVRRTPNGLALGRLTAGKSFIPGRAIKDKQGRIWYYVDFIYASRLKGYISSTEVSCEATSFH